MRHHYIPQFLLRAWADSTADQRVAAFRLDLPHLPSDRHTPKYTAFEHDLYALTQAQVLGMEQHAVEKHFLRRVDEQAAGVLRKLGTTGFRDFTDRDRSDWARFLMSLHMRRPEAVQTLRTEPAERLRESLTAAPEEYQALATAADPPTMLEWMKQIIPVSSRISACRFLPSSPTTSWLARRSSGCAGSSGNFQENNMIS
jgi:hypothetical protein